MSSLLPLRYAWRSLRRAPGFTFAAGLTLALGVAATTAIFSVMQGVLLRPLPYGEPDRLASIWHEFPGIGLARAGMSLGSYFHVARTTRAFESVGIHSADAASLADPSSGHEPERVQAAYTNAELFPTLRVAPIRGRTFNEIEDRPGGPRVVVIGEGLWRRRFGADASIVGRTIVVDGESREVIGIMPASFRFPEAESQLWLPLALDPATTQAGGFDYHAVARLRPGVTWEAARAELQSSVATFARSYPMLAPGLDMAGIVANTKMRTSTRPLRDDVVGSFSQILFVVAATAGLVLLVACANVANLLLVRAEGRQKELTVRAALGATRSRVLGHFLAEGAVLAAIGGGVGLALAMVGVRLLVRLGPAEIPRLAEVRIDLGTLAFTALVSSGVAILCSLLPALRQGAVSIGSVLREGGRSGTAGRVRQRTRGALVAAQVALALVMLAGSGLLARSVWQLESVRPGFDRQNLLTLQMYLPSSSYRGSGDLVRFHAQLVERVTAQPGVRSAAVTSMLPLQLSGANLNPVWTEERVVGPDEIPPVHTFVRASSDYFQTMGIPLLSGRGFTAMDASQTPFEVVVSRDVAMRHWNDSTGQRSIGKRLHTIGKTWYTVVGIVESVRDTSLTATSAGQVYYPVVPGADSGSDDGVVGLRSLSLVVRTNGDPRALAGVVTREVRTLDPSLPVFNVRTMEEVVARSFARISFTLLVLAVAAGIALVLGGVGLYGVVAYVVSLRTREIGVRIALGARPAEVGRLVARQGVLLALAGVGAGLGAFLLLARSLRALLYGVSPTDPITLVAVSMVLVGVAALASWVPARRAARIDPVEAMRAE